MIEWFKILDTTERVLWLVAVFFTLIFFYQIIFTLIKKRPDRERKFLFSHFFAFKNITAFFSMFGWMTIACLNTGFSLLISLLIGIGSGLMLMAVMSILFFYTQKLKESKAPAKNGKGAI